MYANPGLKILAFRAGFFSNAQELAEVVKLVNTADSKSADGNILRVRVPPSAHCIHPRNYI